MAARVKNCRIVLVRARNPLNIGAAARAMANFGFDDLMLVEPYAPSWQEAKSAVGAEALLKTARVVPAVAGAVEDRTLVIGTSSMQRRSGDFERVRLQELQARIRPGDKVALLFGSERTGLTNAEISHCHWMVRIPTVPGCPSMNLAQAVAVCCYELTRHSPTPRTAARPKPAPAGAIEKLREELDDVLRAADYIHAPGRPSDIVKLRRLLLRLNISSRDVATLRGMVAQLRWKLKL